MMYACAKKNPPTKVYTMTSGPMVYGEAWPATNMTYTMYNQTTVSKMKQVLVMHMSVRWTYTYRFSMNEGSVLLCVLVHREHMDITCVDIHAYSKTITATITFLYHHGDSNRM